MNNLNLVLYIVLHYITMFPVPQNDAITNNNLYVPMNKNSFMELFRLTLAVA